MRRVPYHQSVFDLLDIQPADSAQARAMIEACERGLGQRLPEAVRQWYLIDRIVPLREDQDEEGHLWYDYSNQDHPESLEVVLRNLAGEAVDEDTDGEPHRIRILVENQGVCSWFLQPDGSDDPPVVVDEDLDYRPDHPDGSQILEWVRVADRFSDFVFDWMAGYYFRPWTPLSERSSDSDERTRPPREKPYLNGLWLYASRAEPLAPPYLDYLLDNFAEESRKEIAAGVMQHSFRGEHGRIRVTTDDCRTEGGVSAWWLHADSEEGLFGLARQAWWCCDLPAALRHWTKAARPVMDRLRELGRG